MMRRMRHPTHHNPRPRSLHVKEFRIRLPPCVVLVLQRRQALSAVLRIALDELQPRFRSRQRRSPHINSEHVPEPQVLAHALMYHLLAHAAPPRISFPWPHRKIRIAELAPHADHLHPLGRVSLHQKCVSHNANVTPPSPSSVARAPPPACSQEVRRDSYEREVNQKESKCKDCPTFVRHRPENSDAPRDGTTRLRAVTPGSAR